MVGDCSNQEPRWTNVPMFGCYMFQYSGCGGNGNNFYNKKKCQESCGQNIGKGRDIQTIDIGIPVFHPDTPYRSLTPCNMFFSIVIGLWPLIGFWPISVGF